MAIFLYFSFFIRRYDILGVSSSNLGKLSNFFLVFDIINDLFIVDIVTKSLFFSSN